MLFTGERHTRHATCTKASFSIHTFCPSQVDAVSLPSLSQHNLRKREFDIRKHGVDKFRAHDPFTPKTAKHRICYVASLMQRLLRRHRKQRACFHGRDAERSQYSFTLAGFPFDCWCSPSPDSFSFISPSTMFSLEQCSQENAPLQRCVLFVGHRKTLSVCRRKKKRETGAKNLPGTTQEKYAGTKTGQVTTHTVGIPYSRTRTKNTNQKAEGVKADRR